MCKGRYVKKLMSQVIPRPDTCDIPSSNADFTWRRTSVDSFTSRLRALWPFVMPRIFKSWRRAGKRRNNRIKPLRFKHTDQSTVGAKRNKVKLRKHVQKRDQGLFSSTLEACSIVADKSKVMTRNPDMKYLREYTLQKTSAPRAALNPRMVFRNRYTRMLTARLSNTLIGRSIAEVDCCISVMAMLWS